MDKKCQPDILEREGSIIPMEQEKEESMSQMSKEENDESIKGRQSISNLNTSLATNYSSDNQSLNSLNLSVSSDHNNPVKKEDEEKEEYLFNTEYLNEIYMNLILEENNTKLKIKKGYMDCQRDINDSMRAILVDWLIDVHLFFRLKQKTLFQTINIIDLYLSQQIIEKSKFQLLAIASLLISCKENEIFFPTLKDFVNIADKAYTQNEILKMEKSVLQILNFDILCPTAEEFYNIISRRFNFNKIQYLFGAYFLESALIDYNMTNYEYSIIASACAYIVMKYFGIKGYNNLYSHKTSFDNSPQKNIKECSKLLCFLVRDLSKSKLRAAKNKYSLEKFGKVAVLCEK